MMIENTTPTTVMIGAAADCPGRHAEVAVVGGLVQRVSDQEEDHGGNDAEGRNQPQIGPEDLAPPFRPAQQPADHWPSLPVPTVPIHGEHAGLTTLPARLPRLTCRGFTQPRSG
jgi:hypothetical protein